MASDGQRGANPKCQKQSEFPARFDNLARQAEDEERETRASAV
jgi:hypothetical protein